MTPAEIQRELDELETRLERLRIKYDQYFTGIEKMLPFVARKDVDRRFQTLHREQMRNTSLRFRFQTLVQRFTAYQMYWGRIIRQIEDGTYRRDVIRAQRLGKRIPGRALDENGPQELDAEELEELEPEPAAEVMPPLTTAPGLDEPAPSRRRPAAPPLEDANEPSVSQPFPQREAEEFSVPPRAITPPPRAAVSLPPSPQITPAAPPAAAPSATTSAPPASFVPRAPPGHVPSMQPVQRPAALAGGRLPGSATGTTPPGAPLAPRGFVPPRPPGAEGPVKLPVPGASTPPRPALSTPPQAPAPAAPSPAAPSPAAPSPAAPSPAAPSAPRVAQPSIPARPVQPSVAPRPAQPSLPPRPSAAPSGDDPAMRQLYDRYVAARKQTGESSDVRFETVAKQVKETLPRLAEKYQDADVRLDVAIKDGKAILRPVVTMRKKP